MSEFVNLQKLIAEDQALHRGDSRFDAGIAFERQRIIKLLESQLEKAELEISLSNIDLPKIIALIKGENK